ncbi:hypothetical protein, variant [Aphanomyces invadans]|uniref:SAM domain-containing protein n=1 Tax=Aphanomyces invadans TaxID=157072 RepID=A0A024TYN4_9STRA|nr:hypothetical protein, variant [Aphanomyces invadans]ETV99275.1 hypothetical protein, variant [Aphanomyces invadans]|eukprot:XP_008871831.1 hypothetical protein, variant [Aphanomyces invadans]
MDAWSYDEVGEWLRKKGLEDYVEVFRQQAIDGESLIEFTEVEQAIQAFKMPWGHANRLVKAIREYSDSVLELLVLQASPLVMESPTSHAIGKLYHFMEKLDLDTERAAITDILTRHLPTKRIRARFEVATVDSFKALLTAYQIKMLHFSGHGVGTHHELCFENGHGLTHKISRSSLRDLFAGSIPKANASSLQVVFVSSCHSEPVAKVFEQVGVPHIVAVHSDSRIVDASAKDFAKHFYLSLFAGKTVSTSFQNAITAIRLSPSTNSHRACCCSHLHLKTCKWWLSGGVHARHSTTDCCCKPGVKLPHDESSKFLLMGTASSHDVVVFPTLTRGAPIDLTPPCPTNLPVMTKQFVGRQLETYRLVRSLCCGHATVCTGAPGIGKSSLALAAAHYILQRRVCPDGVYYVDLEGLELSAVRYAIARSVGLSTGHAESSSDAEVFAELGAKRCLLVLDKVEELLDVDEDKAQAWLGQLVACATNTRFLFASRRAPVIPNVTLQHFSINELSATLSESLLRMCNPQCTVDEARSLAQICGYLPLALRVIGRALANTRSNFTAQNLIERLQSEEGRLERFAGLPNAGEKECIDRCIRSSFTHLPPTLQLAFMALGLFRGGFDKAAATAVLQSVSTLPGSSIGSSGPGSLAKSLSEPSIRSMGTSRTLASHRPSLMMRSTSGLNELDHGLVWESWSDKLQQLNSLLEETNEKDDVVSSEAYLLLTLESRDERVATELDVTSADEALETLNHWSLLERVTVPRKVAHAPSPNEPSYVNVTQYRLHSMIQLFAEDEASRRSLESPQNHALYLTWRRRFVRHYYSILTRASCNFRTVGNLNVFDENRSNIESALRIAEQLARHSEDVARDTRATKARIEAEDEACDADSSVGDVDIPIVDTLLYALLIVRGRFMVRVRLDPRERMELYEKAIQLSQNARVLNCSCGHIENDSTVLMVTDADYDKESQVLLPHSYDTPHKGDPPCTCAGVMELLALEVLMIMEMGYAYYDVMDYARAEHMYRESLRLQRDVLGRRAHSHVAEVINYLGICLSTRKGYNAVSQTLFRQAEECLIEAKTMRELVLGRSHVDYATSLNNLGNFYKSALQMTKTHGDDNRSRKFGWGGVLLKTADEVMDLYKESLEIRKTLSPDEMHPHVAQSLNNMALLKSHTLDRPPLNQLPKEQLALEYQQIYEWYNAALTIRRLKLGNNNPDTASTLNNLGNLKFIQKDFVSAEHYCLEALKIRQQYYHQSNDRVAQTLLNLGRIYVAQVNPPCRVRTSWDVPD